MVHDLTSTRPNPPSQVEDGDTAVLCLEKVLQRDLPGTNIWSFRPTLNDAPWTVSTARGLKSLGIELLKCVSKDSQIGLVCALPREEYDFTV